MKLFLIALASSEHSVMPQCAKDALTCAQRFSGCDVIALTDMPADGWQDAAPYMESAKAFKTELMNGLKNPLHRYFPMSARYFIMQDYLANQPTEEPIFNCDWDILVFGDLPAHFASVGALGTDLCSCMVRARNIPQAPMLIKNHKAIEHYTAMMRGYLATSEHDNIFLCDITQWIEVRKAGFTDSFSCSLVYRDTYFDPSTGLDDDVFVFDNGSKKIVAHNSKPHFIRHPTGELVPAVAVHTFMGWRHRTPELMCMIR